MSKDNEIKAVSNNDVMNTLKEEYKMAFSELDDNDLAKTDKIIPVAKDLAADISAAFQNAPAIMTNAVNYNALGETAYSITFNGQDVHPEQLWQKKNGSYISNLKGDNGSFGKQADVNVIDNSSAQALTVASSVFAVAAMATSMYYMKNINDKLADIQKTVKSIIGFLKNEKQSQVEADMEILRDIAENMQYIKSNGTLKQIKIDQFSALQRDSKKNILFYEKELKESLANYVSSKKGQDESFEILKSNYSYYRICLFEYALSKLIEIQLTNSFSEKHLDDAKTELHNIAKRHKDLNRELRTQIYSFHLDSIEAKALDGLSSTLGFLGEVVRATPLGKTEIDETLSDLGKKSGSAIKKSTKEKVEQLMPREDYNMMKSVEDNIDMIRITYHGHLELVKTGDETFIKLNE